MSYTATVLKVMIASPSDVPKERQLIREVVHEWNAVNSEHQSLVLMPVGWETHSSPNVGEPPQEIINKQVLAGSDILVAAFWAKMGTPTSEASSGTAREIGEHVASGKPTLVYFSSEPVAQASIDPAQFTALKEFETDLRQRGLVEYYESKSEFREKLARQLAQTVIRYFEPDTGKVSQASVAPATLSPLSQSAGELLTEASKDQDGIIMRVEYIGGSEVQTNGREFIKTRDAREIAKWRGAVDELARLKLIEDRGGKGEVFYVTSEGFRVAETLVQRS